MFVTRLVSGIVLVAVALATILLGGPVLLATILFITLVGMHEFYGAMRIVKPNRAQKKVEGKEYEAKDKYIKEAPKSAFTNAPTCSVAPELNVTLGLTRGMLVVVTPESVAPFQTVSEPVPSWAPDFTFSSPPLTVVVPEWVLLPETLILQVPILLKMHLLEPPPSTKVPSKMKSPPFSQLLPTSHVLLPLTLLELRKL